VETWNLATILEFACRQRETEKTRVEMADTHCLKSQRSGK
jgi:hypothetical protein